MIIVPEKEGQTGEEDDYMVGSPELLCEVASSPYSIDLHRKRDDYEKAGVQEYIVVVLKPAQVFWFRLQDGIFHEVSPGGDGIFRSQVFPGLWLDPAALLSHNQARVLEVLRQGLATAEHAAFVKNVAER